MKVLPMETVPITAWAEQNFLFGKVKSMETGWDWLMNHFFLLISNQTQEMICAETAWSGN